VPDALEALLTDVRLNRLNRAAGVAILPLMLLAILAFARSAQDDDRAPMPAAGLLVVANLREESLTIHDLAAGSRTTLALPGPPHELAESGGRVYVTLGRSGYFAEIDPAAPAVMRLIELGGDPHGLAVHAGQLLVTLDDADALVTIEPVTFTVVARTPTGDTPHAVAAAGDTVVVTATREHVVRVIQPDPRTVPTGRLPEGLAIAGRYAVTADYEDGTLTAFALDETAGAPVTIWVGAGPVRVLALDEDRALAALQGDPSVVEVDLAAGRVARRFAVAPRPDGLCLSQDQAYLGVVSNAADSVALYETAGWQMAGELPAGDGPGACLWVSR